jgi:hypothetical protein
MKKLSLCLLLALSVLTSCSSDEETTTVVNEEGLSSEPLKGVVYGDAFTIGGGYARRQNINQVESISMNISSQQLDCDDAGSNGFPIYVLAPASVGTHTTNVSASFDDEETGGFVSTAYITVEITSITETMVKGKILAKTSSEDNNINGAFSLPICD